MSTVAATDERSRSGDLARLSPLVLLAIAMPWLLEAGIVVTVSRLAPAYEPLVTELADGILYPIVTGTVVLAGLYAFLDPPARRALFRFRRPSRRELLAVVGAVPAGLVVQSVILFAGGALLGVDAGSNLDASVNLRWILVFAVVGGVFAPIVEEVLFRGLLLGYLVERDVPTLAAVAVVALGFGLIHYYEGPVGATAAGAWGIIAIALRLRYDNLVSPVLFHSISNLVIAAMILA